MSQAESVTHHLQAPVLRHKEDNVSVTLDPPLDGFSAQDAANGSLYVIERYARTITQRTRLILPPVYSYSFPQLGAASRSITRPSPFMPSREPKQALQSTAS